MRVVNTNLLHTYWTRFPDTKKPLTAFLQEVKNAEWKTPHDLKASYPTASLMSGDKVVFNIRGNNHRLIALIQWRDGLMFIDFIGSHAEYDKLKLK